MKNLAREGTSVLLTTHYLEEAEALADRVAVINHGRVVATGAPSELGGRQEAPAEVAWFAPNGWQRVKTDQPTAFVMQLEATFGGEVPRLTVTRPSLEEIYLQLIGPTGTELAGTDRVRMEVGGTDVAPEMTTTAGAVDDLIPPPGSAHARGRRHSSVRAFAIACLARGQVEVLQFFRSREAVVFSLALPVVLLALFSSIFSGYVRGTDVRYGQLYTTGLLAAGVASTSFLNLATAIAGERENGALKRLAGTPMPRTAYFVGKAVLVLVTCTLEITVLLFFGHFLYSVSLPGTLARWWTFIWVTFLGAVSMSLIGIAMSSVPRTARSAAPVANLPLLVLEFISGVFVPVTSLSPGLYAFAGLFPLRWIAEGYRSALLPSYFQQVEPNHMWDHEEMALVLFIWCVLGLVLSAKTFRWTGRGER